MRELFEELQKCGYNVHNKRVLGKPEHTSVETKQKDLIQEYALLGIWLLEKYGIWIDVSFNKEEGTFQWKINGELGRFKEITPGRAYESAIEYILNKLI